MILVYNSHIAPARFNQDTGMSTTFTLLGGSLALLLAALVWIFHL